MTITNTVSQSNEQRYYDALRKIAKGFYSWDRITDNIAWTRGGGLNADEFREAAYENMQYEAARAIKGKRRPKT